MPPRTASSSQKFTLNARLVAAGLLTLLTFGLGLYRLNYQSLWYDETLTGRWAVNLYNPSPQASDLGLFGARHWAYVFLVQPVIALIPNAFGMRWPSLLAGTLAVAVMVRAGESLGGRRAGLLAGLLLAVGPVGLYYRQEARPYAIVALGCLFSLWTLTQLERQVRWARWAYPASVVLTSAVHVLASLWLIVLSAWFEVRGRLWKTRAWWVWPLTQLALVAVIALVLTHDSLGELEFIRLPIYDDVADVIWSPVGLRMDADTPFTVWSLPAQAAFAALLGLGTLHLLRLPSSPSRQFDGRWVVMLLTTLTVVPPVAFYVFSYFARPLWVFRYLVPSMTFLLLWVALAAAHVRPRLLGTALAALVLVGSLGSDLRYYFVDDYQRPNWRDAAQYMAEHRQTGDLAFVYEHYNDYVLDYYLGETPIPTFWLDVGPDSHRIARMRAALARGTRVWVAWDYEPDEAARWMGLVGRDVTRLDYVDFGKLKLYLYQLGPPAQ